MGVTSQHLFMSISAAKIPKFASFRRWNGTERKFRLTWPWKSGHGSKVKGHSSYGLLTLAGTRHFAILHSTGGLELVRPPSRLAPEWVRAPIQNQRVACHEKKPLTPEFKVLGQPVTSEVRSMTQKWPKCEFADKFVSEQARAAIYRPERFLWS